MNCRIFVLFFIFININSYAKDIKVISKYCKVNWTQNYIECKGTSAEGQNKYSAIRSAEIIAKKNILEFIQGIKINSELDIRGAMIAHSTIIESLNGTIMGARIIKSDYDKKDGHGEATVKLNIGSDILKSILDNPQINITNNQYSLLTPLFADSYYYSYELETIKKLYEDLKQREDNKLSLLPYLESIIDNVEKTEETGIIIDATGIDNFEIAAIPKIRDEQGNELYPKNIVSKDTIFKKNGVVCYEAILSDAQKNKRVATNPIVIKAKSIYGKKSSDLVIDTINKNKLLNQKELLKNAKVLILVSL